MTKINTAETAVEISHNTKSPNNAPRLTPVPTKQEALKIMKKAGAELDELTRGNKWEEIIDLFFPVEEKLPELVAHKMDIKVRSNLGFALGQMQRFDEAIEQLKVCVEKYPENFMYRTTLAYNAYNSLYAAKNREIFLSGEARRDRIALAHEHFKKAQEIRPDGITNFYREGKLYKDIEDSHAKALPLLLRAIGNWENLDEKDRKIRHQEQKNYIKALFQASSCMLKLKNPDRAMETLKKCLHEDESKNYIAPLYKFFALGKILFNQAKFEQAKDAVCMAVKSRQGNQPVDYALELLARIWISMGNANQALDSLKFIPEKRRRPYIRWTEADALCLLNRFDEARKVLISCKKRDKLSLHKTLIRLAAIEFHQENFEQAQNYGKQADKFYQEKWGNCCFDANYWQAISAKQLGNNEQAREIAENMKIHFPDHPWIDTLFKNI